MGWIKHTHATPGGNPTSEALGGVLAEHYHHTPFGDTSTAIVTDYKPDTHYHLTAWGTTDSTITGEDMSYYVFPQLPGVQLTLTRDSRYQVAIQESLSGREVRSTYWTAPRYSYDLKLGFLRQSLSEVETVLNYVQRHFGQLDSFLIADPVCSTVTDHGFGVGDGSETEFQLQRCDEGYTYDAKGGPYRVLSKIRTNLVLRSEAVTTSPWSATNVSSSTSVYAPDNDLDALQITGTSVSFSQSVANCPGPTTVSLWLKASTSTEATVTLGTEHQHFTVSTSWQRYSFSVTQSGTKTLTIAFTGTVAVWGVQVESGTEATEYIATTSAAVAQLPYYWPDTIGGFEPVYAPSLPDLKIYVNETLQTASQYTVSASGLVTFSSAPTSGYQLTWSGTFYARVRFDGPMQLKRVVSGVYEADIKLVSVR